MRPRLSSSGCETRQAKGSPPEPVAILATVSAMRPSKRRHGRGCETEKVAGTSSCVPNEDVGERGGAVPSSPLSRGHSWPLSGPFLRLQSGGQRAATLARLTTTPGPYRRQRRIHLADARHTRADRVLAIARHVHGGSDTCRPTRAVAIGFENSGGYSVTARTMRSPRRSRTCVSFRYFRLSS